MLVVASEKFHSYIFGRRFTVASDHKTHAMILLNNLPAAIPRLQRMQLRIQRYDMTIKNKPGTEMLLADLMPRLNPLPSKESLNLQKVCLVQFSDPQAGGLIRSRIFSCSRNHLLWMAWKTKASSSSFEEVLGISRWTVNWKWPNSQGKQRNYP